jgi:drug/metabolite transporter (DMT)-like permease
VLGLAGVVILVGWHPQSASREVLLAVAACLVAALLYAIASVYTKRKLASEPSFAVACASQVAASFALMLALPFTSVPGPVTPLVAANVLGLAIGSTAVAYLIYFKLIAEAGPQRALTVTFLLPLFAALWGYVFLGEALTAYTVAGGVLIVAGTALALRG